MRIAVIGAGISGLGAAWLLRGHEVVIFEAGKRIGGHARTIEVQGTRVDTGFLVCNRKTYPLFTGLMDTLGVALQPAPMSFSASFGKGAYEYGTGRLTDLFGQRQRLWDRSHWRMIRDIRRFMTEAPAMMGQGGVIGEVIAELGLGREFRDRFLMPMSGAIWSTPPRFMLDFPADRFLRFFESHGLMGAGPRPEWLTVKGGASIYVAALARATMAELRKSCPVKSVRRVPGGVMVTSSAGEERFDQVIMAAHAPQTLDMLAAPDADEADILGAFQVEPNRMVLHSDESFMPRRRNLWASWNHVTAAPPGGLRNRPISMSYWINRLQGVRSDQPLIMTLNPEWEPHSAHHEVTFSHPQFDTAALAALDRLGEIQGRGGIWYAGAWTRYGFHEDGLLSALRVAQALGRDWPLGEDPWAAERPDWAHPRAEGLAA
ncbi:amine oxidase [Rhodobacter sp. TJ_12]|uniref:NAD(P)/FAD-dependent oxidoreductase n=1 Tax=Rhodobacter sp. TJ_12 TaxID=2029399 RepID=UPI001CBA98A0|nr:FAD-dependent oxidoreductase [Rhodobacter sp. TJ_12]MBZ4021328.1 amine oxidase [Rhodobacter sp. TJ_12]